MAEASNYIPGVCNINRNEIAQRRKAGHIGLILLVFGLGILLVLNVTPWLRLVLVIPAMLMFIGYLQAKNKFCVGYGRAGLQNADGDDLAGKKVSDAFAVRADQKRSRVMNQQAACYAAALTLTTLFL